MLTIIQKQRGLHEVGVVAEWVRALDWFITNNALW